MSRLEPIYHELVETESKLLTDIRICEQKCKELNAKQGYFDQFQTVEDRDKYLKREISFIERQLDQNNAQINEIKQSMEADEEEVLSVQENLTVNSHFICLFLKMQNNFRESN